MGLPELAEKSSERETNIIEHLIELINLNASKSDSYTNTSTIPTLDNIKNATGEIRELMSLAQRCFTLLNFEKGEQLNLLFRQMMRMIEEVNRQYLQGNLEHDPSSLVSHFNCLEHYKNSLNPLVAQLSKLLCLRLNQSPPKELAGPIKDLMQDILLFIRTKRLQDNDASKPDSIDRFLVSIYREMFNDSSNYCNTSNSDDDMPPLVSDSDDEEIKEPKELKEINILDLLKNLTSTSDTSYVPAKTTTINRCTITNNNNNSATVNTTTTNNSLPPPLIKAPNPPVPTRPKPTFRNRVPIRQPIILQEVVKQTQEIQETEEVVPPKPDVKIEIKEVVPPKPDAKIKMPHVITASTSPEQRAQIDACRAEMIKFSSDMIKNRRETEGMIKPAYQKVEAKNDTVNTTEELISCHPPIFSDVSNQTTSDEMNANGITTSHMVSNKQPSREEVIQANMDKKTMRRNKRITPHPPRYNGLQAKNKQPIAMEESIYEKGHIRNRAKYSAQPQPNSEATTSETINSAATTSSATTTAETNTTSATTTNPTPTAQPFTVNMSVPCSYSNYNHPYDYFHSTNANNVPVGYVNLTPSSPSMPYQSFNYHYFGTGTTQAAPMISIPYTYLVIPTAVPVTLDTKANSKKDQKQKKTKKEKKLLKKLKKYEEEAWQREQARLHNNKKSRNPKSSAINTTMSNYSTTNPLTYDTTYNSPTASTQASDKQLKRIEKENKKRQKKIKNERKLTDQLRSGLESKVHLEIYFQDTTPFAKVKRDKTSKNNCHLEVTICGKESNTTMFMSKHEFQKTISQHARLTKAKRIEVKVKNSDTQHEIFSLVDPKGNLTLDYDAIENLLDYALNYVN